MCRVLLVDDEKNVLMTLAIGLQRNDFSVEKAQNGPEALELLRKKPFDFVVSDIRMLPMDGYTLASKIHKQYPEVGIILMSAYGFEANRHKKGFVQLTKPFEMGDLVRLLHQEDAKRRTTRGNPAVLFLAESTPDNSQVRSILRTFPFELTQIETGKRLEKELGRSSFGLILIDEAFLKDARWKVLNMIDKKAGGMPVVILVDKKQSRRSEASGVACIDKNRLIQNPKRTFTLLNEKMRLPSGKMKSKRTSSK